MGRPLDLGECRRGHHKLPYRIFPFHFLNSTNSPCRSLATRGRRILLTQSRGVMIPPLRKTLLPNPPRRHRHELVQDQKLQLEFQHVAKSLYRMADARLVQKDQHDGQDIKADREDVDVDEIDHDAALSDARLQIQDSGQGHNVDAAEDAFRNRIPELGAPIEYGFSGRIEGRKPRIVRIIRLPDERPGGDDHQGCNTYNHAEDPLVQPHVLIHEMQSRIEDQELRGCVYGPPAQDEERV